MTVYVLDWRGWTSGRVPIQFPIQIIPRAINLDWSDKDLTFVLELVHAQNKWSVRTPPKSIRSLVFGHVRRLPLA
jgi:hypothetical protein